MIERTFAILKPEVFTDERKDIASFIYKFLDLNRIKIVDIRLIQMTENEVKQFYKEHEGKDFYLPYVKHMSNKDLVVMILEGEDVISKWRELMGSTDPSQARVGTIRYMFGKSTSVNYVHGSSSKEAYEREVKMFFKEI